MTLIVADIFDGDQIAMVADTLVTWEPGEREARPGTEELAKLVILRDDLAVGVAGQDPHGRIRDVNSMRDADVADLIAMLEQDPVAGFVVAALNPVGVWKVAGDLVVDCTSLGHAWDGDQTAYEDEYRPRFDGEFVGESVPFRQMTSMQAVTSFNRSSVVGGTAVRVVSTPDGFRFSADQQLVIGGSATVLLAGEDPTPGALGIYYPQRGVGGLFRQQFPDLAVEVYARTEEEFCTLALNQYGQVVRHAQFFR